MEGFEVVKDYKLLGGIPGFVNSQLKFNEMKVPKENILWKENEGAKIMFDELAIERALCAAMFVGEARSVLELAVEYSSGRVQFGMLISRFEAISFKIADLATKLEAAKLLTYYTIRLIEKGFNAEKESAMAKFFSSDTFYEVAHNAVQILGSRGLSDESPAEWAFRIARLSSVLAGTNEIMRFIVQREIYREHKHKEKG
jgi:alkylation response protein AidB-like acyl-CoA dehydrogenase